MATKTKGISFNNDASCFVVCGTSGVHIMATDPLVHLTTLDSSVVGSSVRRVEMLERTNLLALLYDETSPEYAENVVRIWDDSLKHFILQFSFPDSVQAVRLLNALLGTFMLVATTNRLYVYRLLPRPQRITTFETADMASSRLAISQTPNETRFAFPIVNSANSGGYRTVSPSLSSGKSAVTVRVLESVMQQYEARVAIANEPDSLVDVDEDARWSASAASGAHFSLTLHHEAKAPVTIQAHQSAIAAIALSRDGALLATASLKGTLIRVFSVATCKMLHTFRRGFDESLHFALAFSPDCRFLASVAQKGTVHLFALDAALAASRQQNAAIGGFLLDSPKSTASFQLVPDVDTIIAFGSFQSPVTSEKLQSAAVAKATQHLRVYSVLRDGTYHKHVLAADGSTCVRDIFERFDELFSDDL